MPCSRCKGHYCAKKVSIFSELQESQIQEVSDMIVTRKYKKGQVIFFEGDTADRLYIINNGRVKVYKYTKEGKEQILYILAEGDFVGDLSLLKKGCFDFNAEALEDTAICTLAKKDFDNVIMNNPHITLKILEKVHDRLVSLENLVQRLSTKDVESRIAGVLLGFVESFGVKTEEGIVIEMPLSREELGNYTGIARETISRKLTSMQDEGIIELVGTKRIVVKDLKKLQEIEIMQHRR